MEGVNVGLYRSIGSILPTVSWSLYRRCSETTRNPLLVSSGPGAALPVNIYPYFSYIGNPCQIPIEYALFISAGPVIADGNLEVSESIRCHPRLHLLGA
ncbi:hypothetical protein HPP92_006452 [Vanilla planifolia]|uniref:Uncharacterized protein n=1 Tax=Vanilla planifolia TaxID=51239 RepID=A0A835REE4_VANPL|nr:hypothetical protein HPP92_006452 [Vanilla planifolia]